MVDIWIPPKKLETSMKIFTEVLVCSLSIMMLSCGGSNDCKEGYINWCDGDDIYTCHNDGESGWGGSVQTHVEFVSHCSRGTCREYKTYYGTEDAGCLASQDLCPEGINYLCVGSILAACNVKREAITINDCDQSQYRGTSFCMVSPVDNNGYCTFVNETCTTEDAEMCISKYYVAVCEKGLWSGLINVSETYECADY